MPIKVKKIGITKKKGYLYFIDKDGDIAIAPMKKGGTKCKERSKPCKTKKATAKKKTVAKKSTAKKKSTGTSTVSKISKKAKSIRKPGEKWQTAIKRASKLV